MADKSPGRPREFDRDDALRAAATLFWQYGFSGTSTRALATSLGISSSSLYAAFGSKADLFDEAVRTYALRYSAVYDVALAEPTLAQVIFRLLAGSIREFVRTDDGHPGCLTSSAVMVDTSATLDVRTFVTDLQRRDEGRLRDRIERSVLAGDVPPGIDAATLSGLVQTLWHGLSTRADLGADVTELTSTAELAVALLSLERSAGVSR
ncbi:TetR/AcrR family transcriptional regulator [Frigoribacterium sp. VKM Ac-2836]|uniref:TetR/AcrR family transcriptional regulator n=1 Tax=Frigoribacterium sp. VKM Ac-2836 TaxID=2739014 RepID=UPI0015659D5B|nr:TetR/AcrR family transcriptional regulator [Frigoribacterium sp. VKM Ac-2836]NRD27989.1 TetR/AcrR family transcriptional regulator [Frigoribacterium sp. VKM Ac-2836]